MSGTYEGWLNRSNYKIVVNVRDAAAITITEVHGDDVVATVDLSKADAELMWAARPTEPNVAWATGGAITIAPNDVDEFAELLRGGYTKLT